MAYSRVWVTLKNPHFEKISIFEGCDGSRMPKMHSGGVWNIFEKILNFSHLFTTPWPISRKLLKLLGPKGAQNGLIWYVETLKNPTFEEICFFEDCSGHRIPKVYSWRVWNIFQTILLLFSLFHHFFCIFCWSFEDLTPKKSPKWPNLWY